MHNYCSNKLNVPTNSSTLLKRTALLVRTSIIINFIPHYNSTTTSGSQVFLLRNSNELCFLKWLITLTWTCKMTNSYLPTVPHCLVVSKNWKLSKTLSKNSAKGCSQLPIGGVCTYFSILLPLTGWGILCWKFCLFHFDLLALLIGSLWWHCLCRHFGCCVACTYERGLHRQKRQVCSNF